jgi:hypothetical protein
MPAAVVTPCTVPRDWMICPAPRKPMPPTIPSMTRAALHERQLHHLQRREREDRGSERHHHVRAQSGRLVLNLPIPADGPAEHRRQQHA